MAGPAASIVTLYRLFWSRVEYVLGKSDTWTSCTDAIPNWKQKKPIPPKVSAACVALLALGETRRRLSNSPVWRRLPTPPSKHSKKNK